MTLDPYMKGFIDHMLAAGMPLILPPAGEACDLIAVELKAMLAARG